MEERDAECAGSTALRRSREDAARTREKIVRTASRQFRKHGIGGIGIADVMAKAGLTHGGFYKHFASKQELAAEACRWALAATRQELAARAAAAPQGGGLRAIVEAYLSMEHRDNPERGCIIAALAGEIARLDATSRHVIGEGFEALAVLVAGHRGAAGADSVGLERARVSVTTMVGALTISRTIADRDLAEKVLQSARDALLTEA